MRSLRPYLVPVAVALGSALAYPPSPARAAPTMPPSPAEPRRAAPDPAAAPSVENAALLYWRYTPMLSEEDKKQIDAWYTEMSEAGAGWELPGDAPEFLERERGRVEGILRASRLPACDFGLERELGLRLTMPHLSAMRLNARLLAIDARWHAAAGRSDEAAERLAAILKLAEHIAADGVVISSQVGIAIAAVAARTATAIAESGGLTPDARNRIADAADAMRQHQDPFHILAVLQNEEQLLTRLTVEQPEEIVFIAESIGFRGRERLSGLPGRSPQERQRMAAGLTQAYNHLREARAAGRTVGPEEVRDRSGDDGWGPVAALVIPTTAKALAQEAQIRKELETLTELLRSDHVQPEDAR